MLCCPSPRESRLSYRFSYVSSILLPEPAHSFHIIERARACHLSVNSTRLDACFKSIGGLNKSTIDTYKLMRFDLLV